jgi:CheY-like chemotaxis protein
MNRRQFHILMAEDDPDDRVLVKESLDHNFLACKLDFVGDGEQLLDYLRRNRDYATLADAPLPDLILLDLNMPRKDGREALRAIKVDPALRRIPIVVLTTSRAEDDVFQTYDTGGSSFIIKPSTFDGWIDIMKTLVKYWFETVELPAERMSPFHAR